ncbi:hypothetical protein SYK_13090 [Pseudodesulfovibrio nedwellii]|uniref:Uncharacterized protein n=1 Tax=Pseudodesulfovibrio nedwellii TaxID=2973072 RepID=A0ABM8AZR5_9BACT|nr:hypothetical protein [Pseudodesulfovibrio nedwellii]BDQ36949.1 hypothetical protein SYK_13090 [Pseudodesulfovibrio nedwellii]
MPKYYVNKNQQATGEHEVHEFSCGHLPAPENRVYLGVHETCKGALREAKKHYDNVDGCYYCCNGCHRK